METWKYRVRTPMRGVYTAGYRCKGFIAIPLGAILVVGCDNDETAMTSPSDGTT
jgi:hypothetical protein